MIIVDGLRPIAPGGYHGHHVPREELLPNRRAIRAFIHNAMRQWRRRRHLRQHHGKDGTLMPLAGGEDERDPMAFIATTGMDCGGSAAPRAAQSLCGVSTVFFHAPAAC